MDDDDTNRFLPSDSEPFTGAVSHGRRVRPRDDFDAPDLDRHPDHSHLGEDIADALIPVIERVVGPGKVPHDLHKHLLSTCTTLQQQVLKILNLKERKTNNVKQADAISRGEVVSGIKPFRQTINISELDQTAPSELLNFQATAPIGSTFRQVKEKLHYSTIMWSKTIDAAVMNAQIETLKQKSCKEAFMDKIRAPVVDTDQDVNDLMDELGFSQFGSSGKLIHLSAAKGEELYLNVMKRVAAQQKAERTRRDAARGGRPDAPRGRRNPAKLSRWPALE